ncbi:16S rRNA (guanine(527)-N(7))-methyltransferase RsmG [Ascidiimonas aurantiaca]|uniref:16S rRNA (guanine(527)-N(7))-methyltransferase RsmG n=1 Tax=Ascidiimonas aurantiaca TaxID=1685432 RepID=UPI0030EB5A2A
MEDLERYFPELSLHQLDKYRQLQPLYETWNALINVISRKDIEHLYERHVLHSLGIAKVQPFLPGASVLDVGTGGGFPGIPLAIMFPDTHFVLIDAIAKKIKVVEAVASSLGINNIQALHIRAENVKEEFDFVVSRAVTQMPDFVKWVHKKVKKQSSHQLTNGILYLKGGDLTEELSSFPQAGQYPLSSYFEAPFFETKKVVHLPLSTTHRQA